MNQPTKLESAASWLRARLAVQRAQFWAEKVTRQTASNDLDHLAKVLEQAAQEARNAARDALVRELAESIRMRPGSSEVLDY
jgi:lipopolysaccharide biosynthesis regulator YciM